jgi:hypothetical protein
MFRELVSRQFLFWTSTESKKTKSNDGEPDSWGEYPIPHIPPATYPVTANDENLDIRNITYEYEYGI